MPPHPPSDHSPKAVAPNAGYAATRRGFLTASGVGALSLLAGGRLTATAAPMSDQPSTTQFAMVTDVHANVDAPDRADLQRRVMEHIEARDPAFVLNCGDIADVGAPEEFEFYRSHVPDTLWDRVRHVPGNHESQWSTDAFEAYDDYFGPTYFSFDAGGLHVVGLDVAGMHGWSRRFGQQQLQWLENDLERLGDGTPVIIFVHVPVGSDWHYAYDDEELLRVIEPYPVRGIFNGHTHSRGVTRLNGYTQVTGRGFKDGPYYYWVELMDSESGPALEVTEVEVPADGEVTHEFLTEIPLADGGPSADLGPLSTSVRVAGSEAVVRVESPADAPTVAVMARVHPHQVEYDGRDDEWTDLTGSSRRWIGRVDLSDLPPGIHKVEVRAVDDADGVYDSSAQFEIPAPAVSIGWTVQHAGSIRGALAQTGDRVVMATTEGVVESYRPTTSAARSQWRTEIGPVYRAPVVTPAGEHVLVPSADHHLYALDMATGTQRWRTDLEAPVMSEVAFGQVDGQDRAFVAAGARLFCLGLDGEIQWTSDLRGVFRGAAACDGERVYAGSADGRAYALDARTGSEQWSRHVTDESTQYWRHLIGPWASHVRLLPDGVVLFSTFYNVQALDGATGELRWNSSTDTSQLQVLYTPPTVTAHGILVFDGYDGTARLLDTDSGEEKWSAPVLPESFGTAPVPATDAADETDDSVFWMVGKTGRLVRIDLANQTFQSVLQVSWSFTESTAALVGSGSEQALMVGGEDGRLHGLVGLDQV